MKKLSSLLLGSAAAVSMMAGGAVAADMPIDEPAVAVCDAFGTGFWVIPGTSNCVRISGEVRADYTFSTKKKKRVSISGIGPALATVTNSAAGGLGGGNSTSTPPAARTRRGLVTFTLDQSTGQVNPSVTAPAATNGQVDPIRVLTDLVGGAATVGTLTHPAAVAAGAGNTGVLAFGEANLDDARSELAWASRARLNFDVRSMTEWGVLRAFVRIQGGGGDNASINKAYVQFAGLTAGWNTSFYNFDDVNDTIGGSAFDEPWDTHMLAYTFAAGNGISATLSLEDPRNSLYYDDDSDGDPVMSTQIRHDNMPDIVAALEVSQAWGKVELSGIYHKGEANTGTSKWKSYNGWGVAAGAAINVPMLSGTVFNLAGAYGSGLSRAIGMGSVMEGGFGDVVSLAADTLSKTKGWSISSGLDIMVSDQITINLAGSYLRAKNALDGANYLTTEPPGVAGAVPVALDNEASVKAFALGASVGWSPVADLTISLGVHHNQATYNVDWANTNLYTGVDGQATFSEVFATDLKQKVSQTGVRLRIERDF